jgi:hypothetical protein
VNLIAVFTPIACGFLMYLLAAVGTGVVAHLFVYNNSLDPSIDLVEFCLARKSIPVSSVLCGSLDYFLNKAEVV